MFVKFIFFLISLLLCVNCIYAVEIIDAPVQEYDTDSELIISLAFTADGEKIMFSSLPNELTPRIYIWDLLSGEEIIRLADFRDSTLPGADTIDSIMWNPFARNTVLFTDIYSSNYGKALLYNSDTWTRISEFDHGPGELKCAAFTPGGQSVVTGGGELFDGEEVDAASLRFWSTNTGELQRTVRMPGPFANANVGHYVSEMEFSYEATRMIYTHLHIYTEPMYPALSSNVYVLLSTEDWHVVKKWSSAGFDAAFSPTENVLATRETGSVVTLYDILSMNVIDTWNSGIYAPIAFSPDGRFFLFGTPLSFESQGIALWDMKTMSIAAVLVTDDQYLDSVWSPDGTKIMTRKIKEAGQLQLWDVSHITQSAGVKEWEEMGR